MDFAFENSGDEEEENAIVAKVLDEIGIEMGETLSKAPRVPKHTEASSSSSAMKDNEVEEMLRRLKAD